jgi:hypothetical protein
MAIGKVEFSSVVARLSEAQKILNREINPTVSAGYRVVRGGGNERCYTIEALEKPGISSRS